MQEFRAWRAVPESDRAPAAAWWWGTAVELLDESDRMSPEHCDAFGLPKGCSYAHAAGRLMDLIAGQKSLASAAGFPRKPAEADRKPERSGSSAVPSGRDMS
ncbi:hypothetical protein [Rhodopseudomonas telluris]|uniref:Uncharacterized protein n=1 Tax=Rhodopseudomonas telluris TaxID=644215 RepID=A0ABV6EMY6_9BRAD